MNGISRLIESTLAAVVLGKSIGPNHDENRLAVCNRITDHLAKIRSRWNRVHVFEDRVMAEALDQMLEDSTNDVGRISSAVGNEQSRHGNELNPAASGLLARCFSLCGPPQSRLPRLARGLV